MSSRGNGHALVIGGSMAGLLMWLSPVGPAKLADGAWLIAAGQHLPTRPLPDAVPS